jgi:hypothetical protein
MEFSVKINFPYFYLNQKYKENSSIKNNWLNKQIIIIIKSICLFEVFCTNLLNIHHMKSIL